MKVSINGGRGMENLFILLQKDRKIKRQIQVLKYLSNGNLVTAEKMSEDLDIHRGTLKSDITALQGVLSSDVVIKKDFRRGYYLVYPESNGINYYIAQIARQTLVYKIIDNLFHGNEKIISNLAEELYTSESVILRLLTHMNKILSCYNISISTHTVKFVGRETDIRTFLFSFFATFMDYYAEQPIDEIYERSYNKSTEDIGNSKLHLNNAKIFLWTVISRVRILAHYTVLITDELYDLIENRESYIQFKEIYFFNIDRLKDEFNFTSVDIPESETIWAYIVTLDCIEYVKQNEMEPTKSDIYRKENDGNEYDKVTELINKIMKTEFQLETSNDGRYETIVAYMMNIHLLSKLSHNFQKVSVPLKKHIQESYHDTYVKWRQILGSDILTAQVIENAEDISVTLTMLMIPFLKSRKQGNLNILFSFESESGYSTVLVDVSQLLVIPGVHAKYAFSSAVTPEFIQEHQIDILVSNFKQRNEENIGCKIIKLSYIPTLTEWTTLRNEIIQSQTRIYSLRH